MPSSFVPLDECRQRLAGAVDVFEPLALDSVNFRVASGTFFASYGGRDAQLSRVAAGDLLEIAHAPTTFLRRDCDSAPLQQTILDYCKHRYDQRVVFARRGDTITHIHPTPLDPLGAVEVFDTIRELSQDWVGATYTVNGSTRVKFVTRIADAPAKRPGDITQTGLLFDLGREVRVAAYLFRLVCSNGAQRVQFENEFVAVATRDLLPIIRFSARRCLSFAQETYLHEFLTTAEQTIEDPAIMLRRLGQRHRMPLRLSARLLDGIPSLPPPVTYYDVINLVTSLARDYESAGKLRIATHLETFADTLIAESHGQVCSRCHGPL